ncbi:MAG: CBS domain-containing protein [Polyangiaceae bacterium]|nr:CBS domain-containing protein [Polyangiaceae bacterium]
MSEGSSASNGTQSVAVSEATEPTEKARDSVEEIDVEPDPVGPPLPPSLRVRTAKDSTGKPLGITSNVPPPVWPPKVAADVMTRKIITLQQDEPIGDLEANMKRFGFRHLPVVEQGMKLVGLISRTDILHARLGRLPDGSAVDLESSTPAGRVMRKNVVVARIDTPLSTAGRVMLDKKLTCLPVALEDGTLVGVLTKSDFLKLAVALMK